MANAQTIALHPSGQQSGSGNGAAEDIGETRSACVLTLIASEVTGGPLKVYLETSADGVDGWRQVAAFTSVANIHQEAPMVYAIGCSRYVRVRWELGTSATFAVTGEAHQLMATASDLRNAAPGFILKEAKPETVAFALITASTDAEDALSHLHQTPLTRWSASVTKRVCHIAVYEILMHRGFSPDGTDDVFVRAYEKAMKWLESYRMNENRSPDVEPRSNLVPKASTGDAARPQDFPRKFTTNFGDF